MGMRNSVIISFFTLASLFIAGSANGQAPEYYRIGAGDILSVFVWQHPDLSSEVPVMSDGTITYPLCGRMKVSGFSTDEVKELIRSRLKEYIVEPEISVNMSKYSFKQVSIIGEVSKPGSFAWVESYLLSDYVGLAGGPSSSAKTSKIYISRKHIDNTVIIEVNLDDIISKGNKSQDIPLQPGDMVTVPQKFNWTEFRWAIASVAGIITIFFIGYRIWD